MLSQRREVLDDVETITAYALDMSMFLNESELTERRAFIESFVKEIVVMPDNAVVRYTIPMPDDSPIPGRDAEEMAPNGSVLSTFKFGGPKWTVDGTIFEMWLGGAVEDLLQHRVEVEALVDAVAGFAHPGQAVPQGLNLQVASIGSVHGSPSFRAAARRRTCLTGAGCGSVSF